MNKRILKFGLLAGFGASAYMFLFYAADPKLMLSPWVSWSSMIIYVAAMIAATLREREATEDDFFFREAVRPAFGVYVIAQVIFTLFNYVLYNYVNTDLVEIQRELMVTQAQDFAEKFGRADLEEQIANISTEDLRVSFKNSFLGFMWSLIGGFVLSSMIALGLKR
jgi:hypothetical protein